MKITFIFSCSGMFRHVPGFIDAPVYVPSSLFEPPTTKFCTHDVSNSQKTRHFLRGCHAYWTRWRKVTMATNLISDLYLPKETHPQFLQSEWSELQSTVWRRAATEREWIWEWYYKFTWEKNDCHYAVSRAAWNITHSPVGQLSWPHHGH